MTGPGAAAWHDALLAARLFAHDPHRLGGIRVHARPGAVRDRWLAELTALAGPVRKLPANIATDRLLGGLDLGATLSAGRPVASPGLLAEADGGIVIVPMAERMAPHVTASLLAALDTGAVVVERDGIALTAPARIGVVLLDEGEDGDETPPAAVLERLALAVRLDGIAIADMIEPPPRARAGAIEEPEVLLCEIAAALGVVGARAPCLAFNAAKAAAGGQPIAQDDIEIATRLSLLPRATRLPRTEPPEQEAPQPRDAPERDADDAGEIGELADRIVEAAAAALPAELLAGLERAASVGRAGSGAGSAAMRKSLTRGRPVGVRPGEPGSGARLHLVETLRAAVPWQRLRGAMARRVSIRKEDFRIRRYAEKSESTLIFAVDASGSAAAERLAETKGAVELLLAEAYVKRTQVALVAFRGTAAEVVLPPTRSLVRAKKCLAALPGGGGTPLAAGVEAAHALADAARGRGRSPFIVLMTDGRANVARDGSGGRAQADADAIVAARRLGASGIRGVVMDVAARPRDDARKLAAAMRADYAALPRVEARAMRRVIDALLP
jgi:magnesium chelatase subunit D